MSVRNVKSLVLIIVVAAIAVAALGGAVWKLREVGAQSAFETEIKDRVMAYNAALSRGFEKLDMQALNGVATRDQAYTEYFQMAALGEERVRLLAELKTIDFAHIRRDSEGTSTVDTIEKWDYRQVSLDTSETVRMERATTYRLTYRLIKARDGHWLVDEIKATGQPWRKWPASIPASEAAK